MNVVTVDQAPDETLLSWYVGLGDQQAFAELVKRYGPMVRATCRRLLGDASEVDDASQAVFVILARKATKIREPGRLGPWLHTVAVRAARKARQLRRRQQTRERTGVAIPEAYSQTSTANEVWLAEVDEVFQKLPARYREPMVLCELQGLSRAAAAQRLALPEGTLSSRLARARELLRQRLLRRGFAVTAAVLTTGLAGEAQARVTPALIDSITMAATSGAPPAAVTAITEGVLKAMIFSKLKWIALLSLGLVLAMGGAGISARYRGAESAGPQKGGKQLGPKSDKDLLQGSWKVLGGKINDKDVSADELKEITMNNLVFKGDKLIARFEADYKLDQGKMPKEIDVTPLDGPPGEKGETFRGLYELKGDDLKIGINGPGAARPKNFDDAREMHILIIMKRVKAEKVP
jgi:RNA polymerase sigma factor (sigma-70 family)